MKVVNGELLRRLTPALVVGGVLVVSFLAQAPSLASNNDVGYGYANNCGVKGDGMHDHGKVCPNRPFPGHGFGVLLKLGTSAVGPSAGSANAITKTQGKAHTQIGVTARVTGVSQSSRSGTSRGHGRGSTHGHSRL